MVSRKLASSVLVILLATAGAAFAVQVDGYRAPGVFDAAAYEAEQAALCDWLLSEQPAMALAAPITVSVPSRELAELERQGRQAESKMVVGVTAPADALVDLSAPEYGAQRASDKGRVWTGAVHSEGASALRVHLTDLMLPEGAELYIYNSSGEAFGPYTGRGPLGSGELWTHTVTGDTALLQLRGGAPDTYFRVAEVGHFGDSFPYAAYRQRSEAAKSFCSFNASCVENAECPGTSSAVNDARDAVAHYSFVQRPWIYICSGGLIADEAQSGTPYFLTANHCVSRDKNAATVETYFFFTTSCNGACYSPATPHTVGASIAATNSTGDYTILRLNQPAPAGAAFLGFDPAEVAFTSDYALYRISHPKGAPQAYSEHKVDTATGPCSSWPRGSWIYSQDTNGATEGGSSGSPVVNSAGLVVGQLSGACGYNLNDVCDSASNTTVDGAFAGYYPAVASLLGGGTSCPDADGDGYTDDSCGGTDCNDGDFSVNPGAAEICDDLVDNNCDGQIDEGCGGSCLPKGASCSANSDCCSLRCHPKKLTCS